MEYLKSVFFFHEDTPLIFTRFYFWGFFAIVLTIYSIIYRQRALRNTFLFFASLFFYYKTSGLFFLLLLFSTLADYTIGLGIYHSKKYMWKRVLVGVSIFVNLGVLSYYKYSYLFIEWLNHTFNTSFEVTDYLAMWVNAITGSGFDFTTIILPVGISFFTFQTISYSMDIYRGKVKPVRNILDFGFYVSFFPQLVAGPIVRASEFVPQLYKKFSLTREEFGYAIFLILNGLFKKMILGDYIAVNFIDRVFENPSMYSSFENLMALYGYSLQVYCDFSGYTDIAIGVALLMGFRLPKNFNSPYKATSVGDFWKRWHMSLSSWLKDYLYIPLGGNRSTSVFNLIFIPAAIFIFVMFPDWEWGKFGLISGAFAFWILSMIYPRNHTFDYISMAFLAGLVGYINLSVWYISAFVLLIIFLWVLLLARPSVKQYITTDVNLMMTMLLGGLWHGASTNFIVWGGLNGVGLVVYKLWSKISPYEKKKGMLAHFWKVMLTFNFITFTRIFFRGEDYNRAGIMINKITSGWDFSIIPDILWSYKTVFLLMLFGYIIHWLPGSFKESYRGWFIKTPVYVKATVTAMVVFAVYQAISADMQPFIYFQF